MASRGQTQSPMGGTTATQHIWGVILASSRGNDDRVV